jgi:hypothetical protein
MILNYYFDDFLTFFLKTLERLDAFNIIHGQKQPAECSSPASIKTPSNTNNSETITIHMSKEELQEKIDEVVVNTFAGCFLGVLTITVIHWFFF